MPREFKTIFRLVREGQISDKEAFQLAWTLFVALSGYRQREEENCQQQPSEEPQRVEVRGFAPQE